MKVLVCGSRGFRFKEAVASYIDSLDTSDIVISGGAYGPDSIAADQAALRGLGVILCPADWKKHGSRAGYIRNIEMLDLAPDAVVAFYDGQSRGTMHTLIEALKRNIPTWVFTEYGTGRYPVGIEASLYTPIRLKLAREKGKVRMFNQTEKPNSGRVLY